MAGSSTDQDCRRQQEAEKAREAAREADKKALEELAAMAEWEARRKVLEEEQVAAAKLLEEVQGILPSIPSTHVTLSAPLSTLLSLSPLVT